MTKQKFLKDLENKLALGEFSPREILKAGILLNCKKSLKEKHA